MSGRKTRRAVSVQLSIHAPKGTRASIIQQAILHKCETGEDTPGIVIRVIDWTGRKEEGFDSDTAFRALRHAIRAAHLHVQPDREG